MRILLVILMSVILFTACQSGSENKVKVAVVISTYDAPWFEALAQHACRLVEEKGWYAEVYDSKGVLERERENMASVVSKKFDVVLFNPIDADGSVEAARIAKDHDMCIVSIDRELNAQNAVVSQVLSDNYCGGAIMGAKFVEIMNGKANYIELLGEMGDNNTWSRSMGFHSVVNRQKEMKMVSQQPADFSRSKANEVVSQILRTRKDVDAIFCGNDAMALGALDAVMDSKFSDRIKIFGYDGEEAVVELIGKGKIAATAMQQPETIVSKALDVAEKWLDGHRDIETKINVEVLVIENTK